MKDLTLAKRTTQTGTTPVVLVNGLEIGSKAIAMIAGPCAVESEEQMMATASALVNIGIPAIRGGVYKPRTSPYSFQGLGKDGLKIMATVKQETGLAIISEVMSIPQLEEAQDTLDCLQIGSRNMQNFELLKAVGRQEKPVLLKRGLSATLQEFLYAAEYIMAEGNHNVILCERGIRSFDPMTRNVLDLGAVALLKELTHLPVIVDPSHATGKRSLITPASKGGVAVGADGLIIEAHPVPDESVSDAAQALSFEHLKSLASEVAPVALSVGRSFPLNHGPDKTAQPLPELVAVG